MLKFVSKRLNTKVTLSAALIALLLSGCASKVDTQDEQQKVHTFIDQSSIAERLTGEDEIDWWHNLKSEQLNQLVDDALLKNHDLRTSQLQLQSVLARIGAEEAKFLPQGGAVIGAQRGDVVDTTPRQSSANLALSWQLDLFGRISALVDAAQASAMSQAEQGRLLQIEVVSSVVKGYVSYQGHQRKKDIILLQVEALQQSINVLEALVEEGAANELDLNRTRAQLSQQEALLPAIEYAQYRDLSTLAVLTGRLTSAVSLQYDQRLFDLPFRVALAQPSNAIALRPDISRALYQFSQANSLSVAASKALLPEVSLSAFAGVLSLGNLHLADTDSQWQVSPQIEWSLLSYPALLAERDAQQYLSEAAYSEYQQVVLKAINESELALQLLVEQGSLQRYADQRYYHANNAFLQAQAMYQEGQVPYLELLDARQDVLIAEENAVDLTISSLLAKVNAYQAFNGRWSYELATAEKLKI